LLPAANRNLLGDEEAERIVKRSVLDWGGLAVAIITATALSLLAPMPALATAAPAVSVSVTSPSYGSSGGMVIAVATVTNVLPGYTATMSTQVSTLATSCDLLKWKHGASVSQKCLVNLPTRAGSWALWATATLTRPGAPTRVYSGSKIIKTNGTAPLLVSASVRELIRKCYNTTQDVWLTFDDGYTSQANLNSILNTLRANNVRGRFFLVGSWARSHPSMVRQITAAGHYVENHTNTHPQLDRISDAAVSMEIAYGQAANSSPKLLRPPYGAGTYTTRLYYLALQQGYRLCYWGTDTRDWAGLSASAIVNKVVWGDSMTSRARAGDSILMHLSNTQARYALPTIIRSLRAKGLTFDRLR